MPYLTELLGVDLPGAGHIGTSLNFWTDHLDDLVVVKLKPRGAPAAPRRRGIAGAIAGALTGSIGAAIGGTPAGGPITLPGIWAGETVTSKRRWQVTYIDGAPYPLRQYLGKENLSVQIRTLLLSENTLENPLSGGLNAGLNALSRAIPGPIGELLNQTPQTCYDEFKKLWTDVLSKDDEQGAPQVWEVDSETAAIIGLKYVTIDEATAYSPPASEEIEVTMTLDLWTDFDLEAA